MPTSGGSLLADLDEAVPVASFLDEGGHNDGVASSP
jgi:hypothetical protein